MGMSANSGTIIDVRGLAKSFDDVQAVAGVDFDVAEGEIFGFLGPNGAGKTTTINMLTGLARPDEGTIRISDIDCSKKPKAAQHLFGVVPDESNLYPELSGFENLCFCGALYGMKKKERTAKADELLATFSLKQAAHRKFKGYSRGMKRKLAIAAGIIHSPAILFLDEPTTGIDVASARQIRQLIADLNTAGTTVFLTTHYIEEAERLCARIAFIVSGRIVQIETVENLLKQTEGRYSVDFSLENMGKETVTACGQSFPDLEIIPRESGVVRVTSEEPVRIGPLVRFFEKHDMEVKEARRIRPSLENVFVKITGIEKKLMKKEKERGGKGGGS